MLSKPHMNRRPLIAANWKMNLGRPDEALALVRAIRPALSHITDVDVVVCPPFTVLAALSEVLRPSHLGLGAQNLHWESSGAHTGEVSAAMLAELCQYVIVGHSERRATGSSAETDDAFHRKVRAALEAGLHPIVCVGENLEQNESGATDRVVSRQVMAALGDLPADGVGRCIVAYEPVWAIGSGRAATPAEANRVMGLSIRSRLENQFGAEISRAVRILYGGSVTAANIADFMVMPDIDGALVGGASLEADGFVELVRNAKL